MVEPPRWLRIAVAVTRALSPRWAIRLGAVLGWGWYRLVPIRRNVARRNVAGALGDVLDARSREAVIRGMYRHFGVSIVELLRFSALPPAALRSSVDVEGEIHLDRAVAQGRGVLVLTAHLGNWEVLVRAAVLGPRPVSIVTRRLTSRAAQDAWRALRQGGATLLDASESARSIVRALAREEIVAFVLDQHAPPRRAVSVPFFGVPAATSLGLARIARMTGAPVIPAFVSRHGDRHRIRIEPPVAVPRTSDRDADVALATAQFTRCVELAIRRAPEQWLWIHRRWKLAAPLIRSEAD